MKKINNKEYINAILELNTSNCLARWKAISNKDGIDDILKKKIGHYTGKACYSGMGGGESAIFTYSEKRHMTNVDICRDYLNTISSMKGIFRSKMVETKDKIGILYKFPKYAISRSSRLLALTMFRFSNESTYQIVAVVMSYLMSRDKIVSDVGEVDIDHSNPWNLLLISSMSSQGSGHNLLRPLSIPRFVKSYEDFEKDFKKMKKEKMGRGSNIHSFCGLNNGITINEDLLKDFDEIALKHGKKKATKLDTNSLGIATINGSNIKSIKDLNNRLHYLIDLKNVIIKDEDLTKLK